MTKKKNKFDLTHLVHEGTLMDGQTLYFVSDPSKTCKITKQPNGEYKVTVGGLGGGPGKAETLTIFAFAQKCLGVEPPDHATKWLRNQDGKTLFDLWHAGDLADAA